MTDPDLTKLEAILKYKFSNQLLLLEALTHPSIHDNQQKNYERLEFLGDTILNFIVSELLLSHFQDKEGLLAKRRAVLVCKDMLATIARELNLGNFIIMARGEEEFDGRKNEANLENVLEALIAAIYLDSDIELVKEFVIRNWKKYLYNQLNLNSDPKSSVQEWVQKLGKPAPQYVTISQKGPTHLPIFEVELRIQDEIPIRAQGKSKKNAEKEAARIFLKKYGLDNKKLE